MAYWSSHLGILKAERDLFPHLLRWFDTIIHQKLVQEVIGEVTFCEKLESLPKDHQSGLIRLTVESLFS